MLSSRGGACAICCGCALLLPAPALQAQQAGWGGSVAVVSDYVYRGLTLSDNLSALQGDLHYYTADGWFAGAWITSVKRNPYVSTSAELDAYLGHAWSGSTPWSARLFAVHHDYPWDDPRHYNYDELSGSLAYADRAALTVSFLPDASFDGPGRSLSGRAALSYDLALHQPLWRALSANAGVGYYDLRWAVDSGYVYWNAGLGYAWGPLQLDLSWIGTDQSARELYYPSTPVNRLVGTVLWRF
jgi:uncharacterized protein (TIGR02001 family)